MNMKEKNCIFGNNHKADVSFMFVATTVAQKPRRQRALKSVAVCYAHVSQLSPLLTSDAEKPTLDTLDVLCEAKRSKTPTQAILDATAAAVAMNRKRWNVLKIGHKKGAQRGIPKD